jgi:hypothetical protein
MDNDLPVMLQLSMWCINGFGHNGKLSSQMRSEGLRSATLYALRKEKGVIMLRNDTP